MGNKVKLWESRDGKEVGIGTVEGIGTSSWKGNMK
jgi:hypothetical protein